MKEKPKQMESWVRAMYTRTLICICCLTLIMGCRKEVDLLLYNGLVYTVDRNDNVAEAMVTKGDRIIAVGNEKDLRQQYNPSRELDLKGNPVYPGFFDPHCHFFSYGLSLRRADLTGTRSIHDIVHIIDQHFPKPYTGWVIGRGWDQNDWPDKHFPDRHILDSLFPENPVCLTRIDGHADWVNSKALELAGIGPDTRLDGGEVLKGPKGPTGILVDNAMSLVEKLIPRPGRAEKIDALCRAQENCFAKGLTSLGDAGLDCDVVMLIDSLQREGILKMRINAMLIPSTENIRHFIQKGIYLTDRLTVRSIKLFSDGALGSRGAHLKKPYTDARGTNGIQVTPTNILKEMCELGYRYGYQVNTHCIGDSAVSLMLHLYAAILPPENDLRWRIEHAQIVDPVDMPLFRKYRIIPSVQTTHATSDMYWAGERLGPIRIHYAYAYRSLLEQNGWIPNGSDFPVESINPLYGFYAGVARKDLKGYPPGGYHVEEAITREQALRAMTIWAARAAFREQEEGSLEPGKKADFVITDRDIMKIPVDSIPNTKVLETWIGGENVYHYDE